MMYVSTMLNVHTIRLIRDGEKCVCVCLGGGGYGGGWRGRLYTYRYTVTTKLTPALRWAAMRAILIYHKQSHKTVSTNHNFGREGRAEADSNRGPSAFEPNTLPPGQNGSHSQPRSVSDYIQFCK